MARNEWTRWGRGDCEGYGLSIGAGPVRFDASVSRGVRDQNGDCQWFSSINGRCHETHPTVQAGMARIEFELRNAGEQFVQEYEDYKARRSQSRHSRAVDAARNAKP